MKSLIKIAAAAAAIVMSQSAMAGISGWALKIGSIDVHVDLTGVGNPSTKPTITVVDAALDQIEYLCLNPSDFNVAPGGAGQRQVSGSDVIDAGNLLGKGKAVVDLSFEVPGPFTCVNPNWTYLPDSEVAKLVTVTIKWFACTGDVRTDTDPCYEGNTLTIEAAPKDQVTGVCTVSPVLRNADGTVVSGQVYSCVQTSP